MRRTYEICALPIAGRALLFGCNLDHGTDLATSADGVPVNMPTHAHGQDYADINFAIPELVQSIEYRKGTYYADSGNFSAAGAVNMRYRNALEAPLAMVEAGENDYRRGLLAASPRVGDGALLFGVDHSQNDGPWILAQNFRKTNALVRYSMESDSQRLALTAQGYDGEWRSTDDITYFYESQLPGESEPVADIHFHPVEPRTFRMTLTASF